jgi:Uma2 family endonuclease
MLLQTRPYTAEEFEAFTKLPENAERSFELIGGEIVEVPSNAFASKISSRILGFFFVYLLHKNIGHLTGEAGGYMVSGERYAPDVAFISYIKQPELAREGYNPNPPDLAVEVDFPSTYESQQKLITKVANYLAAGTVVWVVLPDAQKVWVYTPGQPAKQYGIDGVLDGGDVLPGFTLAVKDIFGVQESRL